MAGILDCFVHDKSPGYWGWVDSGRSLGAQRQTRLNESAKLTIGACVAQSAPRQCLAGQSLCSSSGHGSTRESCSVQRFRGNQNMSTFAQRIRSYVRSELDAANRADARGQADTAFRHLERAHVLGQATTIEHVRVHGCMLLWAIRHRRPGEAMGQVWRLAAASLLTAFGWLPDGNTGGANVSGFRRMPVPPDLQRILDATRE